MQILVLVLLVMILLQQPLLLLLLQLLRLLRQLILLVLHELLLLLLQQLTSATTATTAIIAKTIARSCEGYELALHIVCHYTQDHGQGNWVPVTRRANARHSACPTSWCKIDATLPPQK